MKSVVCILLIGLVSSAVARPSAGDTNFAASGKQIVDQLVENLGKAADQGKQAISNFTASIQEQTQLFLDKMSSDFNNLKANLDESFKNVTEKLELVGSDIKACIETEIPLADELLAAAQLNSKKCADSRIADIESLVDKLTTLTNSAVEMSENAVTEVNSCGSVSIGNIISTSACVGRVVVQTQLRGVMFVAQSAVLTSRIQLSLVTLPAALEVCAGTSLLSASAEARTILTNIATCSISSVLPLLE